MAFLGKVYNFEKEENFDAYLTSLKLPDDKRQAYIHWKPSQKLEKNADGSYTLTTSMGDKIKQVTFKSGEEFDEITADKPAKTKFTLDGNTLIQQQTFPEATLTYKREYNGNNLIQTLTSTMWDGVAYRYYKA